MTKSPKDPREIFPEIIDEYKGLYGSSLISIIAYGSAVGKDYIPGKSDINIMVVLDDVGMEGLDKSFDAVKKWRKKGVDVPLFLTEGYIKSSLDVFPIEYMNFQKRYELLFGKDVLADLTFDREHVRLQCERELKGKLLLLREAFLESQGQAGAMRDVIGRSIMTFAAIFKALNADLSKSTYEVYLTEVGVVLNEIRLTIRKLKSWARPQTGQNPFSPGTRLEPNLLCTLRHCLDHRPLELPVPALDSTADRLHRRRQLQRS